MKKILLVFATVWITVSGLAQRTADIGLWGGTSTYFGDMVEVSHFQSFNPNFGGYFRYNFNARVGLRAMLLTGSFSETGVIEGQSWAFNKSVQDVSLQVEINYLKYILGNKNTPFTSYVMGGLGMAYFPYTVDPDFIALFNPNHNKGSEQKDLSEAAATIPFGIGFKFSIGRRFELGVEYQMRKLLSDNLDDLDDPLAHFGEEGEVLYTSKIHNYDWPAYLGVHLTYKIYIGKRVCPAYESKKK